MKRPRLVYKMHHALHLWWLILKWIDFITKKPRSNRRASDNTKYSNKLSQACAKVINDSLSLQLTFQINQTRFKITSFSEKEIENCFIKGTALPNLKLSIHEYCKRFLSESRGQSRKRGFRGLQHHYVRRDRGGGALRCCRCYRLHPPQEKRRRRIY